MHVPLKDSTLVILAAAVQAATITSPTFDFAFGATLAAGNFHPNMGGAAMLAVVPVTSYAAPVTVTLSGGPTGGTYTLTANIGGNSQTSTGIAYNASAAAIQTALAALSNIGAGNVTVTGTGPFTVAYAPTLGIVTTTANATGLTGGAPAIAVSVPTYSFQLSTSPDGTTWTTASRVATVNSDSIPPSGGVMLIEFSTTVRYAQLTLTVTGTGASIVLQDCYLSPAVNKFG